MASVDIAAGQPVFQKKCSDRQFHVVPTTVSPAFTAIHNYNYWHPITNCGLERATLTSQDGGVAIVI
jgi:hypothetical protein